MKRRRPPCTCTIADNHGRPLPRDRVNMLHRAGCPWVHAAWVELERRVAAGEAVNAVIRDMADKVRDAE